MQKLSASGLQDNMGKTILNTFTWSSFNIKFHHLFYNQTNSSVPSMINFHLTYKYFKSVLIFIISCGHVFSEINNNQCWILVGHWGNTTPVLPLKISNKIKNKNYGIFSCINVIKISFSVFFPSKGFCHKKVSALGDSAPWTPPVGAAPQVCFAPYQFTLAPLLRTFYINKISVVTKMKHVQHFSL